MVKGCDISIYGGSHTVVGPARVLGVKIRETLLVFLKNDSHFQTSSSPHMISHENAIVAVECVLSQIKSKLCTLAMLDFLLNPHKQNKLQLIQQVICTIAKELHNLF